MNGARNRGALTNSHGVHVTTNAKRRRPGQGNGAAHNNNSAPNDTELTPLRETIVQRMELAISQLPKIKRPGSSQTSPRASEIYLYLAFCASSESGEVRRTVERISKDVGCSARQTHEATNLLADLGLVTKRGGPSTRGRWPVTIYTLVVPQEGDARRLRDSADGGIPPTEESRRTVCGIPQSDRLRDSVSHSLRDPADNPGKEVQGTESGLSPSENQARASARGEAADEGGKEDQGALSRSSAPAGEGEADDKLNLPLPPLRAGARARGEAPSAQTNGASVNGTSHAPPTLTQKILAIVARPGDELPEDLSLAKAIIRNRAALDELRDVDADELAIALVKVARDGLSGMEPFETPLVMRRDIIAAAKQEARR